MKGSLIFLITAAAVAQAGSADVVVVGSTPAGIAAAVSSKRAGAASVVILEASEHVGGRFAEALGFDEANRMNSAALGGLWSEWRERVDRHYGKQGVVGPEPHVHERLLTQWLSEEGVSVIKDFEPVRAEKSGRRITRLIGADGRTFAGAVFVDATYLGDVLPLAGITTTIGRESREQYGESLAGVTLKLTNPPGKIVEDIHRSAISGLGDDGTKLLPHVQGLTTNVVEGAGDDHLQCFNLLACMTKDPANRVDLTEPADYDSAEFELLRRELARLGDKARFGFGGIMHDKGKMNDGVPILLHWGLVGGGDDYSTATPAERRNIWERHRDYTRRLLWFLQHDPSVLEPVRQSMRQWGLARDEFAANGHWPWDLYAREGRRMLGGFIMTQSDLFDHRSKPDAISLGSFPVDSHAVRRLATPDGREVVNEGGYLVETPVYQIPYRVLLPKRAECENLLAPVAMSCSRVAFNSLRVEPTWMATGQAAGIAAALAVFAGSPVQDVPLSRLQEGLRGMHLPLDLPSPGRKQ